MLDLFSEHSDAFSETLPISGMTRSGRLFLRPQSEPHTVGNESSSSPGLLRTPCAAEAEGGMLHPDKAEREGQTLRLSSQIVHMVAPDQLKDDLLPTPAAYDGMKGGSQHPAKRRAGGHQPSVADVVEHLLPTPRASDPATTSSHASPGFTKPLGQVARESCADTFGPYADAIARWESVMGREAPAPTELTPKGKHRLSARFVEFMMGQSDGWVTDEALGLSRVQQLRALGNGVVSLQASYAIGWLIERSGNEDLQSMRPRVLAA